MRDIVILKYQGFKPEEMFEHYSSRPLTLSEVHAALAHYYDHTDEIEAQLESARKAAEELQAAG